MSERFSSSAVCVALSTERLQPYRLVNSSDAAVLRAYRDNIRLSEALYPIMQQLEVVFRNQLEQALLRDYGAQWFTNPKFQAVLDGVANRKLADAVQMLTRKKPFVTSGMVVAELTFGFWTTLLDTRYDQYIWIPHGKNLFSRATATERNIKKIRQELDLIRRLRNRIAHHEPI